MTKQTGLPGIWTPWAQVLCYSCHGNEFNQGFGVVKVLDAETMEHNEQPIEVGEHKGLTPCDKCGRSIVLDDSIATEHNMGQHLQAEGVTAHMQQTGGMNSALEIPRRDGGYYLMTYNLDGAKDYYLGEYDEEGAWIDGHDVLVYSYDEMVNEILRRDDIIRGGRESP